MRKLIAAFSILALGACANAQITSFTDPDYQANRPVINKIAVLGVNMDLGERTEVEGETVMALSEAGKAGNRAMDLVPPTREDGKIEVSKAVKQAGADYLLSIEATDRRSYNQTSPVTYHPGYSFSTYYQDGNGNTYVAHRTIPGSISGGYSYTRTITNYTAKLIDLASGNTMWRADGKLYGGTSLERVADDLADDIVDQLAKDGFVSAR